MKDTVIFVLVFGLGISLVIGTTAHSQARLQWVQESCFTNSCVAKLLNELPPERAAEAKLTTWGSSAGALTYVWYRR